MVVNQKINGRAMSMPGGVLLGGFVSLVCTIAGAALTALLIDREILGEEMMGYGCMLILMGASLLGSLFAWRKVKHQRMVVCLMTGLIYLLMLLALTALFFGGQYEAVGVTALMILSGSGTAVLMGMSPGKGKGPARRKIRHRKVVHYDDR